MTKRTSSLPLPQAELDRLRSSLASQYGGQVWEGGGSRILVVRVPRVEPDLVNDIEEAVEYLSPADVQDLDAALLVGEQRTMAVPVGPFGDLMARRVQTDHEQCKELRRKIPSETGHLVYRHPADRRDVARLAVRVPHDSVQGLADADFVRWNADLGPGLHTGKFTGVRCVYLIARQDDVRLDAALFFQDLRERVAEETERRQVAAQLVARQAERPSPPPPRIAYAPLKRMEPGPAETAGGAATQSATEGANASGRSASPPLPPAGETMRSRFAEAGFEVLVRPKAKHPVDLAAERDEAGGSGIQRVIVLLPERLTADVARQVLTASRDLDVDLALVVCADAEPAARRAFIATKARWLHPDDVAELHL